MRTEESGRLIRKQLLVSASNVEKIQRLAVESNTSTADVVRRAIDAYDPQQAEELGAQELVELVSVKLKEAIKSTQRANRKVAAALKHLEAE
ncbi:MAG: hypothetical protein ACK5HY_10520 [Parahaliea sp.]